MAIYFLFILALAMIILPWVWLYHLKPHFAKSEIHRTLEQHPEGKRLEKIINLMNTLFRGVSGTRVSQRERKRLKLLDDAFVYGEIEFLSFVLLLDKLKPQPGEVFYDLGCGAGKAVFTAAFFNDFSKVCGIEFLPGLYKLANIQINKAKTLVSINKKLTESYAERIAAIQFRNANFLDCDISDGDIIFVNATCLSYPTWEALVKKMETLKQGSRVIVTTKKIKSDAFEMLYQAAEVMSWGMSSVNIYRKH